MTEKILNFKYHVDSLKDIFTTLHSRNGGYTNITHPGYGEYTVDTRENKYTPAPIKMDKPVTWWDTVELNSGNYTEGVKEWTIVQ